MQHTGAPRDRKPMDARVQALSALPQGQGAGLA